MQVLHPNSKKLFIWNLVLIAAILYNCFSVPIEIVFRVQTLVPSSVITILNVVSDLVFCIDIVVRLRTGFIVKGQLIFKKRLRSVRKTAIYKTTQATNVAKIKIEKIKRKSIAVALKAKNKKDSLQNAYKQRQKKLNELMEQTKAYILQLC